MLGNAKCVKIEFISIDFAIELSYVSQFGGRQFTEINR